MWSSDFRHIGYSGESGRADSLFRAAVSAFCSLTRPSRRDAAQLEDLALPLLDSVSVESRRYVAAALSECSSAPNALVRRLCEEAVEIAAPLLVRSAALADIDLIALIGRHGMPHARAIARRPGLNKTIGDLIRALEGPRLVATSAEPVRVVAADQPEPVIVEAVAPTSAESTRQQLRTMMAPASSRRDEARSVVGPWAYPKLRDTALTGNPVFFHTALADALWIDFHSARQIVEATSSDGLLMALRALDLGPERAFLIAAAVQPARFAQAGAARLFLERYNLATRDAALNWLRGHTEAAAEPIQPANQAGRPPEKAGKLRAS